MAKIKKKQSRIVTKESMLNINSSKKHHRGRQESEMVFSIDEDNSSTTPFNSNSVNKQYNTSFANMLQRRNTIGRKSIKHIAR